VEETASFLQSLLASHGPNYLEKLFGSKARDALTPLGGVEKVAIALSESQTIEGEENTFSVPNKSRYLSLHELWLDFGAALHLMRSDLEHLRSVFMAVENGDLGMLKSLGIKDSELGDVKFFLEKLVNTGFLDWVAPEIMSPFYYSVPIGPQFYSYLGHDFDGYNFWILPSLASLSASIEAFMLIPAPIRNQLHNLYDFNLKWKLKSLMPRCVGEMSERRSAKVSLPARLMEIRKRRKKL
jgi:hypothetical protein